MLDELIAQVGSAFQGNSRNRESFEDMIRRMYRVRVALLESSPRIPLEISKLRREPEVVDSSKKLISAVLIA